MESEDRNMNYFWGSIRVDAIPEQLVKAVQCKDGIVRRYLNIKIKRYKQPVKAGGTVFTHYISCAPRVDIQNNEVDYNIGNLAVCDAGYVLMRHELSEEEEVAKVRAFGDKILSKDKRVKRSVGAAKEPKKRGRKSKEEDLSEIPL